MADDNVVQLFQCSDGSMRTQDKLPIPGSVEWGQLVIRNILKNALEDEKQVDRIIDDLTDETVNGYILSLVGDLLELKTVPYFDYIEYGKQHSETCIVDTERDAWILNVISDLCEFIKRDEDVIKHILSDITQAQCFTFYLRMGFSLKAAIDGN